VPGSRSTLQDVADRAGVSLSTASRVLSNGPRQVAPQLADRVHRAVAELGYTANLQARAVATGQSTMVGVVVHDIADPYFSSIAAGLIEVAAPQGLLVCMSSTSATEAAERQYVALMRAQRARAVILIGSRTDDEQARDALRAEIKAFTDFTDRDRIAVPAVDSPQAILLRMAAEKFYGAGQFARIDKLLVSMPHPDATAALLAGGSISGYVATPPFIAPLARSERIHAVVTSKEILGGDEATGAALAAVKTFVDANPKVTQAVVAALDEAMTFIVKDPAAAADIYIASESATIPKDQIVDMLKDGTMMYSVAPSGVLKFAAFMAKTGELKTAPKSWHEVFFPVLGFRRGS